MNEQERAALASVRINAVVRPDHVWEPAPLHVAGLHPQAERMLLAGLEESGDSSTAGPLGVVIQGQNGAGKTHLLGWVRRQIQQRQGYFALVELKQGMDFWECVAPAVLDSLLRPGPDGEPQLTRFVRTLSVEAGLPPWRTNALTGGAGLARDDLAALVEAVSAMDPQVGRKCRDVLCALVLYGSPDLKLSELGGDYLNGYPDYDRAARREWGLRAETKSGQEVVEQVTWLLALTGPVVVAVDQIDAIVSRSKRTAKDGELAESDDLLAQTGNGLMELCEGTRRTLTIVSALPTSWAALTRVAVDTVPDRFNTVHTLNRVTDPVLAAEMVRKLLGAAYSAVDFVPPYPTWPIKEPAFALSQDRTPRELAQRVGAHIATCLARGEVTELESLDTPSAEAPEEEPAARNGFGELDARFDLLKKQAEVAGVFDDESEDRLVPPLLGAGLAAWIIERGAGTEWEYGGSPSSKPRIHARLVRILDESTNERAYWSFRALSATNARRAQNRLKQAREEADHVPGVPDRHLILLRNTAWPSGEVTSRKVREFRDAGGKDMPLTSEDVRVFAALRELLDEEPPGLRDWLVSRQPATNSELFRAVLPADVHAWPEVDADTAATVSGNSTPSVPKAAVEDDPDFVTLGRVASDDSPVTVSLADLRRHMAVFAASGSGKTVLLRRLVEECARRGVSSIVLDFNNDLAQLGDHWAEPPEGWRPGDSERAADYHAAVEVVVWTPKREGGRPLAFQPLPNFAEVRGDPDDLNSAVDVAVSTVMSKVSAPRAKRVRVEAVVKQAVERYASHDDRSLAGLIALLSDLPDGVGGIRDAPKLAAEVSDALSAASIISDPLFTDKGSPIDPADLLVPSEGKRARVSVINFAGLDDLAQQQEFISQLQLELFAWMKRHPADGLGALLVMDEAHKVAPGRPATASTSSSIALATQARKFGLGLVFATQAPRDVHHRVTGNANTVVIGKLGVSAQINTAREMAQQRGSDFKDLAGLRTGEFYLAADGAGFHKINSYWCLSRHRPSALTIDEVMARARGERPG